MITPGTLCFVPARRDDGRVDIEATVAVARKVAEDFAAQDDVLTIKIGEAAIKVWNEKTYSGLRSCSPSALGRMALLALGVLPDDKSCKDAEARVKAVLAGQPDKFLIVKSGPKKGVHYRERYSPAELSLLDTQK